MSLILQQLLWGRICNRLRYEHDRRHKYVHVRMSLNKQKCICNRINVLFMAHPNVPGI